MGTYSQVEWRNFTVIPMARRAGGFEPECGNRPKAGATSQKICSRRVQSDPTASTRTHVIREEISPRHLSRPAIMGLAAREVRTVLPSFDNWAAPADQMFKEAMSLSIGPYGPGRGRELRNSGWLRPCPCSIRPSQPPSSLWKDSVEPPPECRLRRRHGRGRRMPPGPSPGFDAEKFTADAYNVLPTAREGPRATKLGMATTMPLQYTALATPLELEERRRQTPLPDAGSTGGMGGVICQRSLRDLPGLRRPTPPYLPFLPGINQARRDDR